jgi:hypothetical protein
MTLGEQAPISLCHETPSLLFGYVDSDWGSDTTHRRSVSGMCFMLDGGVVTYKTRFQKIVANNTTKEEFVAASDAAKMALYVRSILIDIGIDQTHATLLYEDNLGAYLMADAQQPTKRTHHMDILYFSLQDWVEQDMFVLEPIRTTNNGADMFTKGLNRTLFHKHRDNIMGNIPPWLVSTSSPECLPCLHAGKHGGCENILTYDTLYVYFACRYIQYTLSLVE